MFKFFTGEDSNCADAEFSNVNEEISISGNPVPQFSDLTPLIKGSMQ